MENQAIIVIGESEPENEITEIGEANGEANGEASRHSQDLGAGNQSEEEDEDAHGRELDYYTDVIESRLDDRRNGSRGERRSSSVCIFPIPNTIPVINDRAEKPEIVSIGPYHRGIAPLTDFEEYKWIFLERFISRGNSLRFYLNMMMELEGDTRCCYSRDLSSISKKDFVEMMLLDTCFVVELLRHIGNGGDSSAQEEEDDPIFTRPLLIPPLIRDLLKLENQLPFFVLKKFFNWSKFVMEKPFNQLAFKVFSLVLPRSPDAIFPFLNADAKHLLDLFHKSLLPPKRLMKTDRPRPTDQPMQCVTLLMSSGIKFKSRTSECFLDIKYTNRELQIPSITINDFTSTVLINCVAWEQCHEESSSYFIDYISFMNCLINQSADVAFLCSDGIISEFSQDHHYVTTLFKQLGKSSGFKVRDCYLSEEIREIEAYYSSNWATLKRVYFSSPWSFISVFSASLLILLTMVQTIMSVLSYQRQFG